MLLVLTNYLMIKVLLWNLQVFMGEAVVFNLNSRGVLIFQNAKIIPDVV